MNSAPPDSASSSRRSFMKLGTLTAGASLMRSASAEDKAVAQAPAVPSGFPKPTMHVYQDYGWLRGFSVVPSWGARIEEAWWNYDGARMREELVPAKELHANCIRLWIECTAWIADPEKVTANFMDAVAAISEAGMKTMPTLFNRWHDKAYDYGGTYIESLTGGKQQTHLDYLRAIVTPLAKDDRIMIWDLCNEPQAGASWAKEMTPERTADEKRWLTSVAKTVRECGAQQPLTIGTMVGPNIEAYADLCDVLCGHPYAHEVAGLDDLIVQFTALSKKTGKPFLVNECMPGAEDDHERGALAQIYAKRLSAAGFGWMGWALKEGKAISTRRDRVDANGLKKFGFHPFALKNGKLREGLEFFTAAPALKAPWEKA